MATRLKKMRFREVSFCGRGANQHAHVVITKAFESHAFADNGKGKCAKCGDPKAAHADQGDGAPPFPKGKKPFSKGESTLSEEGAATVPDGSAQGDTEAHMPLDTTNLDDATKAHIEGLEKALGEANTKLAKADEKPPAEKTPEELLKDADPALVALVRKAQADATQALELAKTADEARAATVLKAEIDAEVAILKSLENIAVDVPKTAVALQQLRKADPAAADAMVTALRAADAQAESAGIFAELGKADTISETSGDPWDRLQALGKKLLDEGKVPTLEQGIAKAMADNPVIAKAYSAQHLPADPRSTDIV